MQTIDEKGGKNENQSMNSHAFTDLISDNFYFLTTMNIIVTKKNKQEIMHF